MLLLLLATLAAEDGAVIIEPHGRSQAADAPAPLLAPLPRTPITLDVQQVDVRTLLGTLATLGEQNIVVADEVKGTVTLTVHNRPWDETLAMVLLGSGLRAQRLGDTLMVVSPAPR